MGSGMINEICLQQLIASWLPEGSKIASRNVMGDIEVRFETADEQGIVFFSPEQRMLSIARIGEIFKPAVDARLHEIWAKGMKAA